MEGRCDCEYTYLLEDAVDRIMSYWGGALWVEESPPKKSAVTYLC